MDLESNVLLRQIGPHLISPEPFPLKMREMFLSLLRGADSQCLSALKQENVEGFRCTSATENLKPT